MIKLNHFGLLIAAASFGFIFVSAPSAQATNKAEGYRGIWYMNQPSGDEYVYKYSGGLGTYCAKHKPFAIYRPEVNKTFFCYGGATADNNHELVHMVSYFDHETGMVPQPTFLLNKQTSDAHDNPVISMDAQGFIWIFSTSHGTSRPSFIHRSQQPYSIDRFIQITATKQSGGIPQPITNFSYMQPWYMEGKGFIAFFTRYRYPVDRTICFMTSPDGERWSEWERIATIEKGHYQVSAIGKNKAGSAFNFHPDPKGLNWRSHLYYVETDDFGKTWQTADGTPLKLPLKDRDNPALVYNSIEKGELVYLKDIRYDSQDRPVILFITSKGYQSGPQNNPRAWRTARWTGEFWEIQNAMTSDNNYDMGSLYLESDCQWQIIAPTETGPQPYNPGGEVALWTTSNAGQTWKKQKQMTDCSERNHTYVRHPLNAHPEFYAFWADGHGRQPSESDLYFSNAAGDVFQLPRIMHRPFEKPLKISP